MKTKISHLTLLAVTIVGISIGQTNQIPTQAQLNSTLQASAQKDHSKPKITSDLGSRKILSSLEIKKPSSNKTFTKLNQAQILFELSLTSDELNAKAQSLRSAAKAGNVQNKQSLLEEARKYDQQALLIQLKVCELTAEINLQNYNLNKLSIQLLLTDFHGDKNILIITYNLIYDSEKEMKFARELREESKAQPNLASMIGTMGNAEEKELLALHKQDLALHVLAKAAQIASN